MKRMVPIVVMVFMFLVNACAIPAATATQASAPSTATEVSSQPAATEAPIASGTGTTVKITLADNAIDASTTTFQVGVPYTFVITNKGQHAHNFNINPPESVAGSLEEALNKALLSVPQEKLGAGQSTTVEFTFPDSAAGQLLEFSCLIRRHYEDGMKVDIIVTK